MHLKICWTNTVYSYIQFMPGKYIMFTLNYNRSCFEIER